MHKNYIEYLGFIFFLFYLFYSNVSLLLLYAINIVFRFRSLFRTRYVKKLLENAYCVSYVIHKIIIQKFARKCTWRKCCDIYRKVVI